MAFRVAVSVFICHLPETCFIFINVCGK